MSNPPEVQDISSIGDHYQYGFFDKENYIYKADKGLTPQLIADMSRMKGEPEWMLERRLHAYEVFMEKSMPHWGTDLSGVHFDDIHYYVAPQRSTNPRWSITPSARIWRRRASSSWIWTAPCANIPTS